MDKIEQIDRILEAVGTRLSSEIESLLATEFILESTGNKFISKEDAFTDLKGKQISTQIGIEGDVSGTGCLLIGIKDGIRLGGTLIMLPVAELDEVIGREEYSEEIEDSYGEIANIIAGAFTADFEEMYPNSCRFIRKEQEIIAPKDVEVTSSHPVEDQLYYRVTFKMALDGRALGNLILLMPASSFGLNPSESDEGKIATAYPETNSSDGNPDSPSFVSGSESKLNSSKRKQKIDLLMDECQGRLELELSAIVGLEILVGSLENQVMSKEHFFSETVLSQQVIADIDVEGDIQDTSYFAISVKDAIFLGGSLIMLPPNELELVVNEGDFGEDARDAYGEIANIISGIYSAVFEESYKDELRFKRKDLHEVSPGKVEYSSDLPIPDNNYYTSSMSLTVDGKALGQMHMLIPVEVLQLHEGVSTNIISEPTEQTGGAAEDEATSQPVMIEKERIEIQEKATDVDPVSTLANPIAEVTSNPATAFESFNDVGRIDILLVSDDLQEAEKINRVLQEVGYGSKSITTKENIQNFIPGQLKAVYLVMNEVNEQAFGVAIQVSSASSLPIIAAAPGWTRSKVIQAVKYGVQDILLTPASDEDIKENIANNLLKRAA